MDAFREVNKVIFVLQSFTLWELALVSKRLKGRKITALLIKAIFVSLS